MDSAFFLGLWLQTFIWKIARKCYRKSSSWENKPTQTTLLHWWRTLPPR